MKNTFRKVSRVAFLAFTSICSFLSFDSYAQVVLTRDMQHYSQDFNSLPISVTGVWENGKQYIPGWTLNRTSSTTTLLTGTGSSNAGGLYSFGPSGSTDRALGAISSATATVGQFAWGLLIQNNTGSPITSLSISFTGEQWRSASKTAGRQATTFWCSKSAATPDFNLSPLSDLGWTHIPELDFYSLINFSAAGPLNGNLPANKNYFISTIKVDLPAGHYMMLRWKDLNDLDDDHGLAIDDFSLTWSASNVAGPTPMPVEMMYFKSALLGSKVQLDWATASEENSSHFDVQRSRDGLTFETIGSVASKGFSSIKVNYTFTDEEALVGTSYYRLKQVDLDATYEYSKLLSVKRNGPSAISVFPTVTQEALNLELPFSPSETVLQVYDKIGRVVSEKIIPAHIVNYKLNVSRLLNGHYFLVLHDARGQRQTFKFIKN